MCHAQFSVLDRPVLPKIATTNQKVLVILEQSSLTFRQVRWKMGPPPERSGRPRGPKISHGPRVEEVTLGA